MPWSSLFRILLYFGIGPAARRPAPPKITAIVQGRPCRKYFSGIPILAPSFQACIKSLHAWILRSAGSSTGAVFGLRQAPVSPSRENPKPGNPVSSAHPTRPSPTRRNVQRGRVEERSPLARAERKLCHLMLSGRPGWQPAFWRSTTVSGLCTAGHAETTRHGVNQGAALFDRRRIAPRASRTRLQAPFPPAPTSPACWGQLRTGVPQLCMGGPRPCDAYEVLAQPFVSCSGLWLSDPRRNAAREWAVQ